MNNRLTSDHKLYAELCVAIDTINHVYSQVNNSCSDLIDYVVEVELMMELAHKANEARGKIDEWRWKK